MTDLPAHASGTFRLGDREVYRLGYGAMQLTGEWIWDYPDDPDNAIAVLRRAVELGVNLIDTADSYGPIVNEELVRDALYPYDGLLVATKCGFLRPSQREWVMCGFPPYLRQQVELSCRRLKVEALDLLQLHRIDPAYPLADQIGVLADLQREGKIRHLGLSEVTVDELQQAQEIAPIVSVQNLYHLGERQSQPLLDHCEQEGIGFIPWCPLGSSGLLNQGGLLSEVAAANDASDAQVALAWLLAKSPVMLPIPGTSKLPHLADNLGGAELKLSDADRARLDAFGVE